jgi:hypothetical protein
MRQHPEVPIAFVVLYGAAILAGRAHFRRSERWNWQKPLAAWNLGLSLFSLAGFVRVFPVVLHHITHYTWRENFCMDPESHYGSGPPSGLWVQLFILSKIP